MVVDVSAEKYHVKIMKNVLIPMRDGLNLTADLYLPDGDGEFPVVMDYYPYRKDDALAGFRRIHYYCAQRGIAVARVDIRGTGGSEGFTTDEYAPIERQDGCDAIEWLARQDWCNGNVGMTGLSYGAYTSISVAMLQPPSLKAIMPEMGSDDRYSDGDQYRGGAKRGLFSTAHYPTSMVAMNALPPYPEYAGEKWASIWQERLEKNKPWLLEWVGRQVDDEYWQECLGRRWNQIKCPTFIIDGWADPFITAMARLYAELKVPKKLLIGPWAHGHPDTTHPGPQIDYLRKMVQWFAYWLNGEDTGIMDEPPVTIYVQQYERPKRVQSARTFKKGFWRNEDAWPPTRIEERTLYLGKRTLMSSPPEEFDGQDIYEYDPIVGLSSGTFTTSRDQREEDSLSVCYDTRPLDSDLEIAGWPHAVLHVSLTTDVAFFVTRLEDVGPDGVSALVTKGLLNGTRRRGQSHADSMEPEQIYELDIQLDAISWIFERGHKVRLAICSSDWPFIWPSPKEATNAVYRNASHPSRLVLPVAPEQNPKLPDPFFHPPPPVPLQLRAVSRILRSEGRVVRDTKRNKAGIEGFSHSVVQPPEELGSLTHISKATAMASAVDPSDVYVKAREQYVLRTSGMVFESTSVCVTRSTKDHFHLTVNLEVKQNGVPHFSRGWTKSVPRNFL